MAARTSLLGLHRLATLLRTKAPGVNISTLHHRLFDPATSAAQINATCKILTLIANLHDQGHDIASVLFAAGPVVAELLEKIEYLDAQVSAIMGVLGVRDTNACFGAIDRLQNQPRINEALFAMLRVNPGDFEAAGNKIAQLQVESDGFAGMQDGYEAAYDALEAEHGRLKATLEELQKGYDALEAQETALKDQLEAASEEIAQLKAGAGSAADLAEKLRIAEELTKKQADQIQMLEEQAKLKDDQIKAAAEREKLTETLLAKILSAEPGDNVGPLAERVERALARVGALLMVWTENEVLKKELTSHEVQSYGVAEADQPKIVSGDDPVLSFDSSDNKRWALLTRLRKSGYIGDAAGRFPFSDQWEALAVAAGIGGEPPGHRMSVDAIETYFEERKKGNGGSVSSAVRAANHRLIKNIEEKLGSKIPRLNTPRLGAAFSAVEINWEKNCLCVVSAGNLRVKWISPDEAWLLTQDHSMGWYEYSRQPKAKRYYPKEDKLFGIPDALADEIDAVGRKSGGVVDSYLGSINGIGGVEVDPLKLDIMVIPFEETRAPSALLLYSPGLLPPGVNETRLTGFVRERLGDTPSAIAQHLFDEALKAKSLSNITLAVLAASFRLKMDKAEIRPVYRGMKG